VKKGTKGVAAGKKKAPAVQQGKFKSAEIIEDSEEEYDLGTSEVGGQADANRDDGGGEEDEDDFAKMLGESLAEDADGAGEEDDDDEEEEEDDEEYEDELEGARFAPRQSKNSSGVFQHDRFDRQEGVLTDSNQRRGGRVALASRVPSILEPSLKMRFDDPIQCSALLESCTTHMDAPLLCWSTHLSDGALGAGTQLHHHIYDPR
jgi:hypothetical protein